MSARRKFARRVRAVGDVTGERLVQGLTRRDSAWVAAGRKAGKSIPFDAWRRPLQYAIDVDAVRFDRSKLRPEQREVVDALRVEAAARSGETVLCLDESDARSHAERVRRALSDDRLLCGFSAVDMTTGERIAPERLRYQNGIVYVNESPRELSWSDVRVTVAGQPLGPLVEVEFDGVRHVLCHCERCAPKGGRFA